MRDSEACPEHVIEYCSEIKISDKPSGLTVCYLQIDTRGF